jgi:transglutaminase/protease-like cytokinesis protein 3
VGEGYAMAYKALCDELGLECYVVQGTYNARPHAWNIVGIDGSYYHVDVAMCDVNGMSTAFLKKDSDMKKKYTWDASKYKVCDGPLTYTPP